MDTGLDENETELGVLVLAVALKMLADGDSLEWHISMVECWLGGLIETYLLDQHVKVLWDFRGKTYFVTLSVCDQAEAYVKIQIDTS